VVWIWHQRGRFRWCTKSVCLGGAETGLFGITGLRAVAFVSTGGVQKGCEKGWILNFCPDSKSRLKLSMIKHWDGGRVVKRRPL